MRHVSSILMAGLLVICMPRGASADDVPATATPQAKKGKRETKAITVYRINPHAPEVDGVLDDPVWAHATWVKDFMQKQPDLGEPARNRTEVAFIYDDEALYVGARLHSADPSKILGRLSRRDNPGNSERIIISLDTYRDLRTAYTFSVTTAGTLVDYYHASDSEGDVDFGWDPVWSAKTVRTEDGWTAEMRIPFTQLRFNNREKQVWGVNINRWVPSMSEDSFWIVVPRDETGWSSRMGELRGIEGIRPSRRIELLPYAASDATFSDHVDPDDPFNDGTTGHVRFGGDIKAGVGPSLTLEGTINPDFGQVEADPAEVNLTAFETFFPERRPFFTEGSQLFSGGGHGYFYSRRIGAAPSGSPDGDFVDMPVNSSIIGAAKLSGRMNSGLSVGVLGALTAREKATVYDATTGSESRVDVEPATGWGVVRLQKEMFGNGSTAGAILTGVERDLNAGSGLEDFLRKRAWTGGTDWNMRINDGEYEFGGSLGFSHIEGSPSAIEAVQRSSAHFFQRPDADYVSLDPTRRSMNGWTAAGRFEKNAGDWLWEVRGSAESPEFEINDIGQLSTADDLDATAGLRYQQNTPGSLFHSYWIGSWVGSGWNFGRERQYSYLDFESSVTLKNFYGMWMGVNYYPSAQSDNLTRGGPSMGTAASLEASLNLWSNNEGRVNWWTYASYAEDELGGEANVLEGGVTFHPASRWEMSINPRYRYVNDPRQYVDVYEGAGRPETYGDRYVFSYIERSQISAATRLNYTFTPELSLEVYVEPFAASGRYYDHGELLAARSKYLRSYGSDGTTIQREADGSYTVTDGADTFSIPNNDFNYVSYRSNLVLRWQWNPGSTLFVVWQQNRASADSRGELVGPRALGDAFSIPGDNFFAVKFTYWIPFS